MPEGGQLCITGRLDGAGIHLAVANTGAPLGPRREGGLGLDNLEGRLRLPYGKRASWRIQREGAWTVATLDIPLMETL